MIPARAIGSSIRLPICCARLYLLLDQGWRDQDDADALRYDAGLRLAASGSRGTTALLSETHLASQPTLSRLIALLSTPANRTVLHEAVTELAGRRFRGMRGGH